MHGVDAQKAGLSVGRGLFAFADLDRRGPGLFVVAQAVARALAQVVEVAVGEPGQPLELRLAVDLELALEDVPRGRTAEPLVGLVDRGQQLHVGRGVTALETGPKRGLGRDPSGLDIAANQPRGLRPAEPGHVLDVGPQKPLRPPLLKRVLVMAQQPFHPAVNLRAARIRQTAHCPRQKKCLDLNQTQLLCSKHADHPSSACPLKLLQAHLALESNPTLRLILRWTRVLPDRMPAQLRRSPGHSSW
jgi:hypothetical protein